MAHQPSRYIDDTPASPFTATLAIPFLLVITIVWCQILLNTQLLHSSSEECPSPKVKRCPSLYERRVSLIMQDLHPFSIASQLSPTNRSIYYEKPKIAKLTVTDQILCFTTNKKCKMWKSCLVNSLLSRQHK